MPFRPRGPRSFQRGPRPRYAWVPGNDQSQTTAAASIEVSADLLSNYFSDVGRDTGPGFVIERIFGTLIVSSVTIGALTPFMCGLKVVSEGISASAITPKTEVGRWLWFLQSETDHGATETAAGVFDSKQTWYHFDVKGRWRFDNVGDQLVMTMQNDAADNVLEWSIYTRTLLRVT